jgi:hypothetical protein
MRNSIFARLIAFRFSLRSLMVAVALFAIALSIWLTRAEQQRRSVAVLQQIRFCEIGYDFDVPPDCRRQFTPVGSTHRPTLIENAVGVDAIHNVTDVILPANRLEGAMQYLQRLPALRKVLIFPYDAEDDTAAERQLQDAFEKLRKALPGIQVEEAPSCPFSPQLIPVVG